MTEYLACGNIMSDVIEKEDGSISDIHIGGPALYALAGIRMWTKNCDLLTVTGADHAEEYGRWLLDNGMTKDHVHVEMENGTNMHLAYNENDGGFRFRPERSIEYMGYLKTHPYHIDQAATEDLKGIYMANNTDRIVWQKMKEVKDKYRFKIMWELEYPSLKIFGEDKQEYIRRIKDVLAVADMWSINYNEASDLFGIDREDDDAIIEKLRELPAEMTFYRVGQRGSYVISKNKTTFCESIDPIGDTVDPTGCGNCSTGAAMYAWVSGRDELDTVIMANIAAGFNAHQFGPYPFFTDNDMTYAEKLRVTYKKEKEKNEEGRM